MKWVCQHCGYVIEREGYTEICPQCWQATMKGDVGDEQRAAEDDSRCDPRAGETGAELDSGRVGTV